jgi:murein DD-endopeptidase MepM/ murein hydrolase activator NlpD
MIGLGLAVATLAWSANPDCTPRLPERVLQGSLVVARIASGCQVRIDARELRVAPDGAFVFGVGRDAPSRLVLRAGPGPSRLQAYEIAVSPREWRIERVDGVPESTVNPSPAIAARIQAEQARVARVRQRDDPRGDWREPFLRPLQGRVSGVYGSQRILNGTPKDPHYGLDIAAPDGTPFVAPASGIVSFADPGLYLTGGTVVLDHGHGVSSVFIHLSRIDVAVGERVRRGARLGAVGATGRASGPHLHWGMNWFEVRVDPALLLEAAPR